MTICDKWVTAYESSESLESLRFNHLSAQKNESVSAIKILSECDKAVGDDMF